MIGQTVSGRKVALKFLAEAMESREALERLLKVPYYLTPGWLRVDANFDPLRGNPRFEKLARGT